MADRNRRKGKTKLTWHGIDVKWGSRVSTGLETVKQFMCIYLNSAIVRIQALSVYWIKPLYLWQVAPFPSPAAVRGDSCISPSLEGCWYKLCRQSGTLQVGLRCLIFFFPFTSFRNRKVCSFFSYFIKPFVNRFCVCVFPLWCFIFDNWAIVWLRRSHILFPGLCIFTYRVRVASPVLLTTKNADYMYC